MTNEELNTALYEKMFAEQEKYRAWLLSQPPEEILNHTYEYTMREDILLSLEYHDLPDAQARAMLKSPSPLADVFADWEHKETGHMDDIWQTVEDWAKAEEQKHRKKETERAITRCGPVGYSNRPFYIAGLFYAVNLWLWRGGSLCHIFHRR